MGRPPAGDESGTDAGDTPGLRLEQQLCFALYAASNRIQRLYRPLLDQLGLTYPQYLVMLVLWEHGTRTVGELGQALHLDSGTLTPLLKRLQAAGWVERSRSSEDERRVEVRPTAAGFALREQVIEIPQSVARATTLPAQRLGEVRACVRDLLRAMDGG